MSERDSDIEFDFFAEPETEEATERVRTPRRPPPGGPRRPVRPPSGLIPMLRLAGLIAFLILAAVLLVVLARGCASSSKHDRYAKYIEDVRGIAGRSGEIGKELNSTLAATGIKESALEGKIKGYAAQEQQEVAQARDLDPPGPLRVEHDHLIEILQLRASALSRLADAFRQTATAKNATTSGRLIADQARLLVASDVNWDFYFRDPTQRELERQGIRDIGGVPDSNIFPNPDSASTPAMMVVWQRVHGAATGGTPGGKHERDHRVDRPRLPGRRRGLRRLPGVQRGRDPDDPEVSKVDRQDEEDRCHQRRRDRERHLHRHRSHRPLRPADHNLGRHRAGARRSEDRQQLGRVQGHLLGRIGMSLSTAEWIAIGACGAAGVSLLVAGLAWWKLRAVRVAQLVLLGGGKQDLVDFAVSLQGRIDDLHRAVDEIAAGLSRVDRRVDTAVSKTSLVRYDAYEGAGGHQSASIALLDAGRTGVVLTAIQGRDYARIYVKELDRGRPSVALSPEEQEAVERAMGG